VQNFSYVLSAVSEEMHPKQKTDRHRQTDTDTYRQTNIDRHRQTDRQADTDRQI